MTYVRQISKLVLGSILILSLLFTSTLVVSAQQERLKGEVTIWGGAYLMHVFQDTIESGSFYISYPEVKVKTTGYPYTEYARKMKIALFAGEADPDLLLVHDRWLWDFIGQNVLIDLTNRIDTEDYVDVFETVTDQNGKIWGLPFEMMVPVNYYREDILEKSGLTYPETLEDYLQVGKKLKEQDLYWTSLGIEGEDMTFRSPLGRMKGQIFDKEGNVILDTEQGKGYAAAEIFGRMVDSGIAFKAVLVSPEELTALKRGEVVGKWLAHWYIHEMGDAIVPGDEPFGKLRMGPVPSFGPGTLRVGSYAIEYVFLSKLSDCPEAAYAVVEYATSSIEGAVIFANKHVVPGAYRPGLETLARESASWEVMGGQQIQRDLARYILSEDPVVWNCNPNFSEAMDILQEQFSGLCLGEVAPEEMIKTTVEKIRKATGLK